MDGPPPISVSSAPVATIIDGKRVAAEVRARVAADAAAVRERTGHVPGLVTILVGEDPASQVYVRNKIKACEEAGMASFHEPMPATSSQAEVLAMVERYNADDRVDGILVQSPLPAGLDFKQVLERIDPAKDVDGFHPLNVGRLVAGQPGLVACTPAGVMELLDCDRRSSSRAPTPSSSAAPTSSASRSRCSCCTAARPSRCATRARATSPRSPAGPTCSWRRSAGRA